MEQSNTQFECSGKVCTVCRTWRNLNEFAKSKKSFKSRCKICDKKYFAEYYKRNAELIKGRTNQYRKDNPDWKKSYDKNYREQNKESIALYKKQYAEENKDEIIKKRKMYYLENKEKIEARQKDYVMRNKEAVLEKKRQYYFNNKERLLEQHRDYYYKNKDWLLIKFKEWRERNLEKTNATKRRYAARKKGLIDDFTETEQQEVFIIFEEGCALTGSKDIHWDHVIPLAVGHGGTTNGNMAPLRSDLNCSKQDSNIFEWFEANRQRFELSQERFDKLIEWLASANAMSVEEYRDYVYWCHDNPRTIDEINEENESEAI